MSRVLAGPFLYGLWRPEITGSKHIPSSGGAILASNHLSIVDSIFLPLMVSRPVTFAAKSEYFSGTGLSTGSPARTCARPDSCRLTGPEPRRAGHAGFRARALE